MKVRFDDSLPRFAELIATRFGAEILAQSAVIRDGGGRLAVILPRRFDATVIGEAETEVRNALGAYARSERPIADVESPGAQRLLEEAKARAPIAVDSFKVRLLDRRIVGADWLVPPARSATGVPRIVFSSLKGG